MTLTEETSAAELRGHFIIKGGDAVWHDGPFIRAMREGARLVINEISNANPDVLHLLFPILESQETARLTLPTGETIRPAEGFHVVATDNHPVDRLPEPLQDRFVAQLHATEPHPDALAGLSDDLRAVAESALQITDDRRISARQWNNLQALEQDFGRYEACLLVFGAERGAMMFDAIQVDELVFLLQRLPLKCYLRRRCHLRYAIVRPWIPVEAYLASTACLLLLY